MKYRGFTLIELLVALFIVSIIMTITGGIFLQALNLQRRAFNLQATEDDASHVLESLAKEIRVATLTFPLTDTSCPGSPAATITIQHPVNGTVIYSLDGSGNIHRNVGGTDSIMNSNQIIFSRLAFCILGISSGDSKQPRITIVGSVKSVATIQQGSIDVQTTISQRFPSN